jgi:predicted nucleic acid-binding protein
VRVFLDTNIIIHREAGFPVNDDIGRLFRWLDDLGHKKCIHQITVDEIMKNHNSVTRRAYAIKLQNYNILPISSRMHPDVAAVSAKRDTSDNDLNDTMLLNEVYCGRIDALITEDRSMTRKARELAVDDRVFTIEGFLEKATAENPGLVDYRVPIVQKHYLGNIDVELRLDRQVVVLIADGTEVILRWAIIDDSLPMELMRSFGPQFYVGTI